MTSSTKQYLEDCRRRPMPQGFITCRVDWADVVDALASIIERTKWSDLEQADAERLDEFAAKIRRKIKQQDRGG